MNRFIKKWMILFICIAVIFANSAGIAHADNLDIQLRSLKNMIQTIKQNYVEDVSEQDLMMGAYTGVFDMLDPHSTFYFPEELKLFETITSGKFGGVGLVVQMIEGKLMVVEPVDGTPAQKAGILANDIIISINGKSMKNISLDEAVEMMKGKPGTIVKLGIERDGEKLLFELKRETIQVNPVRHEILANNIGYIQIEQFNENTGENFDNALNNLLTRNVKGIILDLRNNPGGLVTQAVHVLEPFIPKGPAVYIKSRDKITETLYSEKAPIQKPLVILINENSASASELIAGAVQDTKSGTIVGTRSYGKGTVQTIFTAPDGSGFKLTIAKYLTPKKRDIEGIGIEPDIIIKNIADQELDAVKNFVPMSEDKDAELGDSGLNVYGAQQRLKFIGYTDVAVIGTLDEATKAAISNFQKAHSLSQTGKLDLTTREALMDKVDNIIKNGREDLQLKKAVEIVDKQS